MARKVGTFTAGRENYYVRQGARGAAAPTRREFASDAAHREAVRLHGIGAQARFITPRGAVGRGIATARGGAGTTEVR